MRFAVIAVVLIAFGCQPGPPREFTAADRMAVDELASHYLATARAGDWDAWTDLWTEDAVYMVPEGPALVGKAAIRASLDAFPDPPSEMTVSILSADGAGDWAWARGAFLFAVDATEDFPGMRMEGSFLWVLERQEDGSWLVDSEAYNSDTPPPPPPAPEGS